ncbi:MAG: hypothetical protein ACOCXX_00925 [Planctomycetota bacterium]
MNPLTVTMVLALTLSLKTRLILEASVVVVAAANLLYYWHHTRQMKKLDDLDDETAEQLHGILDKFRRRLLWRGVVLGCAGVFLVIYELVNYALGR